MKDERFEKCIEKFIAGYLDTESYVSVHYPLSDFCRLAMVYELSRIADALEAGLTVNGDITNYPRT